MHEPCMKFVCIIPTQYNHAQSDMRLWPCLLTFINPWTGTCLNCFQAHLVEVGWTAFCLGINVLIKSMFLPLCFVIRTLHDCPSQMNENLLISISKLTSDSELIWWHLSTNLNSFVRDSHVGCVLYNGKDNHYQIRSWIQIMRNVRVLCNHDPALLAHPCTFGEKIVRFGISWF